jgi:tetratricopeptide (TPR) repeat protein
MAEFVSRAVEQLASEILPATDPGQIVGHAPYQSLNLMFALKPETLDQAGHLLQSAWHDTGDPVHLGLLSYLDTFRVGESWGRAVGNRPETAEMAREGLRAGAFNGLYLTTAGYALFYLTDNTDLAADLLTRAVEVAPAQAMAWDHLALFWHSQGHRAKARHAAERAVALGRFSPLRYAYDTTLSMVAHADGDFDGAVRFGRRALSRKPEFSSALRYVTAGLGLLGRREEAEVMAQQILRLDPTFTADRKTQGLIKMLDRDAGQSLFKGLRLAGLK